jgi:hypothetical protein
MGKSVGIDRRLQHLGHVRDDDLRLTRVECRGEIIDAGVMVPYPILLGRDQLCVFLLARREAGDPVTLGGGMLGARGGECLPCLRHRLLVTVGPTEDPTDGARGLWLEIRPLRRGRDMVETARVKGRDLRRLPEDGEGKSRRGVQRRHEHGQQFRDPKLDAGGA